MNDNEDWLEQQVRDRQHQIKKAKNALFGYLKEHHPEIARIEVHYDGYGDEGNVQDIYYYNSLDAAAEPGEIEDEAMDALIVDLFCCVTPEGFEICDGGDGQIHIFPGDCTIRVDHYWNIVEQESESYEV